MNRDKLRPRQMSGGKLGLILRLRLRPRPPPRLMGDENFLFSLATASLHNIACSSVSDMRCKGCSQLFKNSSGLWRYLSHAQHAACKAIYNIHQGYLPGPGSDNRSHPTSPQLCSATLDTPVPSIPGNFPLLPTTNDVNIETN